MNKQTFLNLIQNTSKAGSKLDKDLKALEVIVANSPYCQTAHLFLAKGYYDKNSVLADKKIQTAAVYAIDRALLKQLIQQVQAPSSEKIEITPSHPTTQEKRILSEIEIRDTQTKKPRLNKEIQQSKRSEIIKKTKKEKEKKPLLSEQEKNYMELKQHLANLISPTRKKIDHLQGMMKGKKFKRNDRKELNKILKDLEESTPSPPSPPLTPSPPSIPPKGGKKKGGRTGQPPSSTRGKRAGKSKKDLQAIINQRLAEIKKEKKSSPIYPGKVTKSPKKKSKKSKAQSR